MRKTGCHGTARSGLAALVVPIVACTPCDPLSEESSGCLPFNFHVLDEGRAYRSGQPTGEQLAWTIDTFDIRTVVNLRGSNVGKPWYDAEVAVCGAKGVVLANHRMSAQSLPPPDVLEAIIDTLLNAEYPILIHCQAGADRAGAISAIYRMLVLGHERSDALEELSPLFFHFRPFTPCMDTLAEWYEPGPEWLEEYAERADEMVCVP